MREFTYVGNNFWGNAVYKSNTEYVVLVDGLLFWCTPKDDPEGEPGFPVKNPYVLQEKKSSHVKGSAEKKFIIAKMIAANEFTGGNSIEWLDLASGIHDLSLTRTLLAELQESPIPVVFVPGKGWCGKKQAEAMEILKKWKLDSDDTNFRCIMLERIYWDCQCYLQNHYEQCLWAKNVKDQTIILKNLFNSLYEWERNTGISEPKIAKMCKKMLQTKK